MPTSPTSLCRDCNSRAETDSRYCAQHRVNNSVAEHKRLFDVFRRDDAVRKLYRCNRWKATRAKVLSRDILCVQCKHKAATVVDHIVPARQTVQQFGVDEFYNVDRLQGLCKSCHDVKTVGESKWSGSHT